MNNNEAGCDTAPEMHIEERENKAPPQVTKESLKKDKA
jgi:hypothetical protein